MRHDYDLPADWNAMSTSEKSKWYTQERCKRQAMRQDTATAKRLKKQIERLQRKLEAKSETVDLEENR